MRSRLLIALVITAVLAVPACGDDDDVGGDTVGADSTPTSDGPVEADEEAGGEGSGSGGGGGTLVLGDETISLDRALCYLEEQDAAAGGGTIELTAQGHGTNAAGEELYVDFSRYSADSQFAGDDINIVIGDYRAGEATTLSASLDIGTVQLDGTTVSATDFVVRDLEAGEELPASFQIDC